MLGDGKSIQYTFHISVEPGSPLSIMFDMIQYIDLPDNLRHLSAPDESPAGFAVSVWIKPTATNNGFELFV